MQVLANINKEKKKPHKHKEDATTATSTSSLLALVVPFSARVLGSHLRIGSVPEIVFRCHYTKSNPIDDHSNIS